MSGHESRRTLPADVAELLRWHRQARGWSLRRAGQETGISYTHIASMESGVRAPSTVVAELLVQAYEMRPADAELLLSAAVPGVGRDWRPAC